MSKLKLAWSDRRQHKRKDVSAIQIHGQVIVGQKEIPFTIRDSSRGGLGLHLPEPLENDSSIKIKLFKMPFWKEKDLKAMRQKTTETSDSIVLTGKVVGCRASEDGYSIGFTPMNSQMRINLNNFITSCISSYQEQSKEWANV
jgi:hypothetical protein